MKKIIILSSFAVSMTVIACNNLSSDSTKQPVSIDTTKLKTGEVYYQCEMHTDVISDKPGNCYKCEGMELEKKVKK